MTVYSPANSTDLATAITNCTFGDTIQLTAGTTYNAPAGGFSFPNKGVGSSWITVTTDNLAVLPGKLAAYPNNFSFTDPTQYRVTTTESANMPKLVGHADDVGAIGFAAGAHHWKFIGVEVTYDYAAVAVAIIHTTRTSETVVGDYAHDIWFEKCFVHPIEEVGVVGTDYQLRSVEKGLQMNGTGFTVKNCAIQGFCGRNKYTYGGYAPGGMGLDTCSVMFSSGLGTWDVENCLLEGMGNTTWGGGGSGQLKDPNHTGTISGTITTTGATFSTITDLQVGDLFTVYDAAVAARTNTTIDDPDGASPSSVVAGWTVGKILTINGATKAVTWDALCSGYNPYLLRLKFGTGTTGGTFTMSWGGQTTSAITFPAPLTVTGATNANPIEITTSGAHGLTTADTVSIRGVVGNTAANNSQGTSVTWAVTVTASNKFTIPIAGNGAYSSGGTVKKRSLLAANVRSALEALSNIAPADFDHVSADMLYVSDPTYGVEIQVVQAFGAITPTTMTVDGTNLTGSGTVSVRIEAAWSEGYFAVPSTDAPSSGAEYSYRGYNPDNSVWKRNILAIHPLWNADKPIGKGFNETKTGSNILWEGNILWGIPTGLIFENVNQGGFAPWAYLHDVTVRSNLFVETSSPIALAANFQDRAYAPTGFLITNNLFLKPPAADAHNVFGNGTTAFKNVTFTHNTLFESYYLTNAWAGVAYDHVEASGFSQCTGWIVKDNFFLQRYALFNANTDSPTVAPYNTGDMRIVFPDMTADHNAVIDDLLQAGDPGSFFSLHAGNWQIEAAISTIGFRSLGPNLDYTGDYRLSPGSLYAAGSARQASDGTDVGVNFSTLITALGFDPFGLSNASPAVKLIAICT